MGTWAVYVELGTGASPPDAEMLDALTSELTEYSASVAVEAHGTLSMQLSVEAGTARTAFDRAVRAVLAAVEAVGSPHAELVGVQVLTDEEYQRRLRHPVVPRLASLRDVAAILGVSKQRALEIVDEHADELPTVGGRTAAGRLWLWEAVERFNRTWTRAQTGRPPKTQITRIEELAAALRDYADGEGLAVGETPAGNVLTMVVDRVRVDLDRDQGGPVVVSDSEGEEIARFTDRPPTPGQLLRIVGRARRSRPAA